MEVKVCPECNSEYFAHIESCGECHVPLVYPRELEEVSSEEEQLLDGSVEAVVLREGTASWLKEIRKALREKKIASHISLSPGCSPGGCNTECVLVVARSDAERADGIIHDYFKKTHPELASQEVGGEDQCPACGHPVAPEDEECPDCGLSLKFEE